MSADGRTVTFAIPGLRPVQQMLIKCRIKAADGAPIAQEIWTTIHAIPK